MNFFLKSNMQNPVDLTNLSEIIEDPEMRKEIFNAFFKTAEQMLQDLKQLLDKNNCNDWKSNAHSFKGMALSVGANNLGMICQAAQDKYLEDIEAKKQMLEEISQEFLAVKIYINSLS